MRIEEYLSIFTFLTIFHSLSILGELIDLMLPLICFLQSWSSSLSLLDYFSQHFPQYSLYLECLCLHRSAIWYSWKIKMICKNKNKFSIILLPSNVKRYWNFRLLQRSFKDFTNNNVQGWQYVTPLKIVSKAFPHPRYWWIFNKK